MKLRINTSAHSINKHTRCGTFSNNPTHQNIMSVCDVIICKKNHNVLKSISTEIQCPTKYALTISYVCLVYALCMCGAQRLFYKIHETIHISGKWMIELILPPDTFGYWLHDCDLTVRGIIITSCAITHMRQLQTNTNIFVMPLEVEILISIGNYNASANWFGHVVW